MKTRYSLTVLASALVMMGCEPDKSTALQDSFTVENTVDVTSNLDFATSTIPFPNNLLFAGSVDGTLEIPVADANDLSDPQVALNALDGFSTVSPITTGFSGALDDATIPLGVKFYEATFNSGLGVITSVDAELTFGVDYVATQSIASDGTSTLAIIPLAPLKPKQAYMVAVNNELRSASGRRAGISGSYALTHGANPLVNMGMSTRPDLFDDATAAQLEQIRLATLQAESALNTFDGTDPATLILSWNFTTQSIGDVLTQTRTDVRALTSASGFSPTVASPTPLGAGNIHVGTLDVPYFLTASATGSDPTALGSFWQGAGGSNLTQFNTSPVATSTQTIPMMVAVPNTALGCTMPGAGWPVVIYQHGITRKRSDLLAIADAFNAAPACLAVVAIDLPMHGITGTETTGAENFKDTVNGERHFDLDLITQDAEGNTTAAAPDGIIDSSGIHYVNLTNLLNVRDNQRQAVSDLFALVDAIEEGSVTDGSNTLDDSRIYFLGHSLGAMVGTAFLALEPNVRDAALMNGGSLLAKILDGSSSFGATIAAGLAANGVLKGTADYEAFIGAAQTLTDTSDPANYAAAAATGRGILASLISGDTVTGAPSDLTVPVTVPDGNDTSGTVPHPLAGGEPWVSLLGLTSFNSDQAGADLLAVTRYNSGIHGSLIDSSADLAVTTEMLTQIVNFLASDGAVLDVTDDTVLVAP